MKIPHAPLGDYQLIDDSQVARGAYGIEISGELHGNNGILYRDLDSGTLDGEIPYRPPLHHDGAAA